MTAFEPMSAKFRLQDGPSQGTHVRKKKKKTIPVKECDVKFKSN